MSLLRRILACILSAVLAPGGAVLAQSLRVEIVSNAPDPVATAAPTDPVATDSVATDPVTTARRPARLMDAATRQAGTLVPVRERRDQGGPPSRPPTPAWAHGMIAGAVVGAYAGFAIQGKRCHCESAKGFFAGAAIGGFGGGLLVWRLTR